MVRRMSLRAATVRRHEIGRWLHPQQKSWCALPLAENETLQPCKVHFSHNLTRDHAADIPFTLGARLSGKKCAFAKASVLVFLYVSGATVQSVSAHCRSSSQKSMRLGVSVRHCMLNARCTAVSVSSCAKCRAHPHVLCGVGCGGSYFQS
jgi:hypothetical protein